MKKIPDEPVTLSELLSFEPFLDSFCLGGWPGKENVITDIVDIKNENKEYSRGSLLAVDLDCISVGSIASYLDSDISGILLYKNSLFSSLTEIEEKAETAQIPVIHSPLTDAYVQAKNLWVLIRELKNQNKFSQFARQSIHYFLKNRKQSEILSYLEVFTNNPTILLNNVFQVINYSGDINPENEYQIFKLIKMIGKKEKKFVPDEPGQSEQYRILSLDEENRVGYLYKSLEHAGYHYGFMITLELNSLLSDLDRIYLEEGKNIILEQMAQKRRVEEIEGKYKTDFIHDLLFNNFDSEEDIIERGRHWGFDLSIPHQLFVFMPDRHSSKLEETAAKIQNIVFEILGKKDPQPIIGQNQDGIVVIIPQTYFAEGIVNKESSTVLAEKFISKLDSCVPGVSHSAGIGRFYVSVSDLCRSFQEAKLALKLGNFKYRERKVTHFDELGVMRLLANVDYYQLDDYYKEYLNKLFEYDKRNETNLLETLMMFFKYNGDINLVAHKMFIHSNSLRYRLKKIEELTGTDLKNYEDILNLFTACKIAVMYINNDS